MADWQQQRDDNCKHMDGCCLWSLETDFFIHKILNLFIFWKCIMLRDSTFMKEIKIKSLFLSTNPVSRVQSLLKRVFRYAAIIISMCAVVLHNRMQVFQSCACRSFTGM